MRERLALLREYLKNRLAFGKNKKTRKGFILTMVALVEVLAISVVSVSAWVETISTITFKAEDAKIDNYVYTNADIGSGNGYSDKTIDLKKYFRAAGGVHLASASSANGENIFFPIKKSDGTANSYRCADVNDKNVNYIDFSFSVKVDDSFKANHAEFYLDHVPTINIGGEEDSKDLVRMAITDTDTQNTVVCGSKAGSDNVVNNSDGSKAREDVHAFNEFVVSSEESMPTELFQVKKGSSKTINIKVWLQDDKAATEYAGKTVSISDVNIVTQNKKVNKVYFVDRTVNDNKQNWTENVTFQQGSEAPVPMKYNEKLHTYYCNYKTDAADTEVKFISKGVTWTTDMKSLNSGESMSYTAYGDRNGNVGYGTWGEVIEISVSSNTPEVLPDSVPSVYMVPDESDSYSKVRMPFTADKKKWVGYIAKEKAGNMTFSFKNNGNTYEIPARNRGNSTLFVVTSAKTGYWYPPATITVAAGKNDAGTALGAPEVSYGGSTSTTISVTPGTKVKLIANPIEGYALKYWVNSHTGDAAYGIDSDGYFTPTASGDYDFTAVYDKSLTFEAYVKTYDGENLSDNTKGGKVKIVCGNQTPTDEEYTNETHITLNAVKGSTVTYYAKANTGYVFDGWYTEPDCKNNSESSSEEFGLTNVQDSKKLYAKFKVDTYTVEAYAQHGTDITSGNAGKVSFDNKAYNSHVTTVNRNGEVTFYAKPESGYAFIGWYVSKDAQNPKVAVKDCSLDNGVYSTKMTIQSDEKTYALYARFKALYTVDAKAMYNGQIDDAGGTVQVGNEQAGKTSQDTVMEGDKVTVKAIANSGYKFAGWYKNVACNDPYSTKNNDASSITLENVKNPITLYAKFELGTGDNTFYLYDGGLWSYDNAKLAAYVWKNNGNDKRWFEVSKTGYDNYYSFTLDNNQWEKIIFVRYDQNKNLNDLKLEHWEDDVLHKTSDITIDYNNNCYVITTAPNGNGKNGTSSGYWMTCDPGQPNVFREIYVNTESCSSFGDQSVKLAYRFSTDDSFNSDCTTTETIDGKTYWKLSIPTDKNTIYLSKAASGGHSNEFSTSIKDKSKNLFTVNNDFNGGDWSTY